MLCMLSTIIMTCIGCTTVHGPVTYRYDARHTCVTHIRAKYKYEITNTETQNPETIAKGLIQRLRLRGLYVEPVAVDVTTGALRYHRIHNDDITVSALLSGFVIKHDERFYVTTAGHIYDEFWEIEDIEVGFYSGDPDQHAKIAALDTGLDGALLQAKEKDNFQFTGRPARVGKVTNLRRGDPVIAVGSPLGIARTVTSGVITNFVLDEVAEGNFRYLLMHSATINPGNSGGPLWNRRGEVIGINILVFGNPNNPFVTSMPVAVSAEPVIAKLLLDLYAVALFEKDKPAK